MAWIQRLKKMRFMLLFFVGIAGIMLWNTYTHPHDWMYDTPGHRAAMIENRCWGFITWGGCVMGNHGFWDKDLGAGAWIPRPAPGILHYNPPLYYLIASKVGFLVQYFFRGDLGLFDAYEFYAHVYRWIHILVLFGVAWVLCAKVLPRFLWSGFSPKQIQLSQLVLLLSLFTIPNMFLAQVMVRPDHLLFFCIMALFCAWFGWDFDPKLATSRWRRVFWAVTLIGMANSRHFALPTFLFFLLWGTWIQIRELKSSRAIAPTAQPVTWKSLLLTLTLVTVFSGHYYVYNYLKGGMVTGTHANEIIEPQMSRWPVFTRFEFDKLYQSPNRSVVFEYGSVAFWVRLYGDMWGDHWLFFSAKDAKKPYDEINVGGPKELIYEGKREGQSANKRRVFLAAIPFALLYFFVPLGYSLQWVLGWVTRRARVSPKLHQAASLLFLAGLGLLMLFVYRDPDFQFGGSNIKFIYLYGYVWFPIIAMNYLFSRRPQWLKWFLAYNVVLFCVALPLYVYG